MKSYILKSVLSVIVAASALIADDKPKSGFDTRDGLSLTVTLDKKVFRPTDEVKLSFTLKNESDRDRFIGDGYPAPENHEAGPGRHFEVYVTPKGKHPLYFWGGHLTECETSGIRKVFKLKPGETYDGSIVLRSARGTERIGSFEDKKTRQRHVLGKDARQYYVQLVYQVNPNSHGVWEPPADFADDLLWTGFLISSPIEIRISETN